MNTVFRRIVVAAAVVALSAVGSACGGGGGGGDSAPSVDVSGSYAGQWNSRRGVSGAMTFELVQDAEGNVTGNAAFVSQCALGGVASGAISGVVRGDDFSGRMNTAAGTVDFDGEFREPGFISGNYAADTVDACDGDRGTFSVEATS